jgi:hypothetical protein
VALVQALVFALLTLVFLQLATTSEHEAEEEMAHNTEAEREQAVASH